MKTFCWLLLATLHPNALPAQISSFYTDLSESKCTASKQSAESGSATRTCPGIGGYRLSVADDDSRMSITVISPDKSMHDLRYWDTVLPKFSHLGDKAEWRVKRQNAAFVPQALIVRVYSESKPSRDPASYLAIAKISDGGICVVAKIPTGTGANEQARVAADASASQPCLAVSKGAK